jgi:hypothetical protein
MNVYGMGGLSSIEYSYQDHFTIEDEVIKAEPISTYQVKGGMMYNVNDDLNVFFNTGLVEKAPIMDNVIYYDGTVASDPANEKFVHNEFGVNYKFGKLGLNASAYNTDWQDRNLTKSVTTGQGDSGDTDVIFLTGVNQKHSGVELETNYMVNDMLDLMFVASFGNWKFDGDANGNYQETEYNSDGQAIGYTTTEYAYALDGLYVGDMPQTSYVLGVTLKPVKGLMVQALHKTYDKNYSDDNAEDGKVVRLGDIIAYHNDTTVDWLGGFAQFNYNTDKMNLYGMGGLSSIEYTYQDHFTVENEVIEADPISAYQVKAGVMYNINPDINVFFNTGLVEKAPIMDNVIYYDGTVASDPTNEKFLHNEFGVNYRLGKLGINASAYNTDWQDRNLTKSVTTGQGSSGDTDVIFLTGVDQKHSGVELETNYMVNDMLDLMFVASFGNWKFNGDANGNYQETEYNSDGQAIGFTTTEYAYALDGLYVGDMPQTSYVLGVTLKPVKGLMVQAIHKTYDKNYSDWSPSAREFDGTNDDADRAQVWEAPGYSKLDLHMSYKLPKVKGLDMTLNGHIFNVLDEVFVQDAVDNSQYNGYGSKQHLPHNAEVFLGTPRYANIGLTINF